MKRVVLFLLATMLCIWLCGCGKKAEENPLVGNIYYFCYPASYESENPTKKPWPFVKFHSDDVIEWVLFDHSYWDKKTTFEKYYGIYELDGNKLTVTVGNDNPIICVVHENGESISIGNSKYTHFDESKFVQSDEILSTIPKQK